MLSSRRAAALGVVLALVLAAAPAACAAGDQAVAGGTPPPNGSSDVTGGPGATTPAPTTTLFVPTTTAPAPGLDPAGPPVCPRVLGRDTTSVPPATQPPAPSTTTSAPLEPEPPSGAGPSTSATSTTTSATRGVDDPAPPLDAAGAVARFRDDPRLRGASVSASAWIDGLGEVAVDPDVALKTASTQKVLTAMAALTRLGVDATLTTQVVATGPVTDGTLEGDLVLVGGGDPTLRRVGPHSVDELAGQVAATGVRRVAGRVLVDDSRYDDQRRLPTWDEDWFDSAGPLSALVVDWNHYRDDDAFQADPGIPNGEVLAAALAFRGIAVGGGVARGNAPAGVVLGRLESPPIGALVSSMLLTSDNLIAELLVKELGHRADGGPGTTAGGLAVVGSVAGDLCVRIAGTTVDGSGISHGNRRSARELRRLVQSAAAQPWGRQLVDRLPVTGPDGVLGGRLADPPAGGNVRAKGGRLWTARTLCGYLTTASGRAVTFAVIVNGPTMTDVEPVIDDFVTALAALDD